MLFLIIEIATFASAIVFYFKSGFSEGFISLRSVLIFPILLGNSWAFFSFIKICLALSIKKKNISNRKLAIAAFVLLIISDTAVFLGNKYDSRLIAETKDKGDLILKMAQEFQKTKGRFPITLNELESGGNRIPTPSLKGTSYEYTLRKDGTPELHFNSVAFLVCWKSLDRDWACDD